MALLLILAAASVRLAAAGCLEAWELVAPPKNADSAFCIRQATLMAARTLFVGRDGTCWIYTCGEAEPIGCLPIFTLQRQVPQLLLRTVAENGHDPYKFLESAPVNRTPIAATQTFGSKDAFKSPLLDNLPKSPFSHVQVHLLKGEKTVKLRFRLKAEDDIASGSWFSRERLESASPWDVKKIKKNEFLSFDSGSVARPEVFFLSESITNCNAERGAMMLTDGKSSCSWANGRPGTSAWRYLWAAEGEEIGTWKKNVQDASEFRLIGDMLEGSLYKAVGSCSG